MRRSTLALAALTLAALLALQAGDALARAGGGGSRGSRSSSAPARPAPMSPSNPSSPSRSLSSPTSPTSTPQPARGGWFGGMMGGLAGFALGGLLGSMLFGGFGHGFGGGIGLLEIILIGGGLFLLFRFMSARRDAQPAYATAGAPYAGGGYGGGVQDVTAPEPSAVASELDRGLAHIRSMDSTFDPGVVSDAARGLFGDVQRALTARDMSPVSARVTSRMYTELTSQCDRLRAARQSNRMEGINVRRSEVTEALIDASGVRRSCETAASRADFSSSDLARTAACAASSLNRARSSASAA